MNFASDNCGPALPEVLQAVIEANTGFAASYGEDAMMQQVRGLIRDALEAPDAAVYLVATGTAANALALSTLTQPWQTIFCTPLSHIQVAECHAPEFYTGGAKLTLAGNADKMTADHLRGAIKKWVTGDVHVSQPGSVSLTQVTEMGRTYSLDELAALTKVAQEYGLPTHMDGARFANAIDALGCTPADMTWKAGIHALSFGGTKNGCMGVEAVVFFDPKHAWEFELRRKRGAHLFSKHRYLSAQMLGFMRDGVWWRAAATANRKAAKLIKGLRQIPECVLLAEPQANMIFATLPRAIHQRLHQAGAVYGLLEGPLDQGPDTQPLKMRLVVDWSIDETQIERFLEVAKG